MREQRPVLRGRFYTSLFLNTLALFALTFSGYFVRMLTTEEGRRQLKPGDRMTPVPTPIASNMTNSIMGQFGFPHEADAGFIAATIAVATVFSPVFFGITRCVEEKLNLDSTAQKARYFATLDTFLMVLASALLAPATCISGENDSSCYAYFLLKVMACAYEPAAYFAATAPCLWALNRCLSSCGNSVELTEVTTHEPTAAPAPAN